MRALITGITGQTGSYLAELLLERGYSVHGIVRRSSSFNTERIDHLYTDPHDASARLFLHYGDLTDASSLERIVNEVAPDEVYNLGAQSHVRVSFDQPIYTADVVAMGTLRLLEAVRRYRDRSKANVRMYQASSSEMFGSSPPPQSITTPFRPRSPYAVAKVFGFHQAINYREAYGLFVANGVLFNHESPRRGETFVTRKITRAVGRIRHGLQKRLYLGNLEARRDWGHARDYAEAIHAIVRHEEPSDFVVATGVSHSVQNFVDAAFLHAQIDPSDCVCHDPRYLRPSEVDALCGDISETTETLGWVPSTTFSQLVQEMVNSDMKQARWEKAREQS